MGTWWSRDVDDDPVEKLDALGTGDRILDRRNTCTYYNACCAVIFVIVAILAFLGIIFLDLGCTIAVPMAFDTGTPMNPTTVTRSLLSITWRWDIFIWFAIGIAALISAIRFFLSWNDRYWHDMNNRVDPVSHFEFAIVYPLLLIAAAQINGLVNFGTIGLIFLLGLVLAVWTYTWEQRASDIKTTVDALFFAESNEKGSRLAKGTVKSIVDTVYGDSVIRAFNIVEVFIYWVVYLVALLFLGAHWLLSLPNGLHVWLYAFSFFVYLVVLLWQPTVQAAYFYLHHPLGDSRRFGNGDSSALMSYETLTFLRDAGKWFLYYVVIIILIVQALFISCT